MFARPQRGVSSTTTFRCVCLGPFLARHLGWDAARMMVANQAPLYNRFAQAAPRARPGGCNSQIIPAPPNRTGGPQVLDRMPSGGHYRSNGKPRVRNPASKNEDNLLGTHDIPWGTSLVRRAYRHLWRSPSPRLVGRRHSDHSRLANSACESDSELVERPIVTDATGCTNRRLARVPCCKSRSCPSRRGTDRFWLAYRSDWGNAGGPGERYGGVCGASRRHCQGLGNGDDRRVARGPHGR